LIRYILDTDHLSLYQRGHSLINIRLKNCQPNEIAITIITVEEQIRGRLTQIKKANSTQARIEAYSWLRETINRLTELPVLDLDADACNQDEILRQQKLRLGTQDRRIAAIALSKNAIVVTRNISDFGQIAGLKIEDWTK